jgi:hypothetical protein
MKKNQNMTVSAQQNGFGPAFFKWLCELTRKLKKGTPKDLHVPERRV